MGVNKNLLPIKAHYFFFMAALGPILPQLNVFGKEIGISPVVMGYITGILPFVYVIAKPAFGLLVDIYRDYRKYLFMLVIAAMVVMYALMSFIPQRPQKALQFNITVDKHIITTMAYNSPCPNHRTTTYFCISDCLNTSKHFQTIQHSSTEEPTFCEFANSSVPDNSSCVLDCTLDSSHLYTSFSFWGFVIFMSIGTICFNVANSVSDAICFDVIGENGSYGQQRVWATIGWGLTALIAGYVVDLYSGSTINYVPAFIVMLICGVLDLLVCLKLKLPLIERPKNIFNDLKNLLNNRNSITFITFAVFSGVLDGLLAYFLLWYIEDLAAATNTSNVKLIEGCIVAASTLGAEVIFFLIAGKILKTLGHVHCFTLCFVSYFVRLFLISVAPSPWWMVPIEFLLQGPTYALTYNTIVEYANKIAPEGASATMQGIAAGMDDGLGYAIGSLLGGLLFHYFGGKITFQIFSVFALLCGITHELLHMTVISTKTQDSTANVEYKSPKEAYHATDH